MPRKLIRRYLPDHKKIKEHKHLRFFGTLLHDPNIWHLNRRSVSGAFAVGLFIAFIPVPFQMVLAAAVAILVRVNLPISAALVWITNPVTMGPMFYSAYRVGAWTLQIPPSEFTFELSIKWLLEGIGATWQPFLLGCLIMGTISAVLGFAVIRIFWRVRVSQYMKKKQQKNQRPGI